MAAAAGHESIAAVQRRCRARPGRLGKLGLVLDWQLTQYEGETPPEPDEQDDLAIRAWGYLHDRAGGINWSGLEYVVAHLGITDLQALMDRLIVIKTWASKPRASNGTGYPLD